MRIRDWSSDVCSSDLLRHDARVVQHVFLITLEVARGRFLESDGLGRNDVFERTALQLRKHDRVDLLLVFLAGQNQRSEERRGGKECVSTFRSRGSTDP